MSVGRRFNKRRRRRVRIRASRTRDSDPDLNPDPGLIDGISPGNGTVSSRWIRPGLRYHQQGPGHNIRWGRTRLAALATVYNKEKEMAITGIEKEKPTPKKDTPIPKKEVRIAVSFCCYFCFTPFFYDFKGIKTKEKQRQRKIRVRIRPFLDGYGLGTRIRTTSVQILIPGPATDPLLRIRSPVLALKHGLAGLVLHFFTDSFDMNFYLRKGVPPTGLKMGGTR